MIEHVRTKAEAELVLRRLVLRAGFDPRQAQLVFPAALDRIHANNRRRYAQMIPSTMRFELARAFFDLEWRFQAGLLAHEVGHLVAVRRFDDDSESGADAAARTYLGIAIGYDRSWPGKGLQYARTLDARARLITGAPRTGRP
jgi:hypothetical protein